jgi:amino acid transporter
MAEQVWFYWYKSRGQRRLVPVSRAGWLLTLAFVVAMIAPGLLMAVVQQLWVLWIMFPWMAVSLFLFFRLAMRHAETIPVDEAVEAWRAQRRDGQRGRR